MQTRWRYLFGEVGIGLRRNLLMTLATILTVTVTVTMVGAALLVQRQVTKAQDVLYADVEVSIFLTDDVTPEQRTTLEEDLRGTPVVADVFYESKELAFENAQQIFAEEPVVLQGLSPDVLPESFRVSLTDPEEFDVIASQFSGRPGIDVIQDQRDVLDEFFAIMRKVRQFVLYVAVLIALAATALVATTIRLTAFARREQTAIMKLVGATNWYIRLPFVIEGITASVIGALGALALLLLGMRFYVQDLREQIEFLPFIGATDVWAVFPILLIGSVVVGAAVSVLALRRFLAV
ncbi:permease-like cell division protein FtsX [Euzebya tangerina]|uniref:permease-like cell division protein FtsX n=1 Tax=Euzebya tangerina TaxID=591198 RepID=UPI000E3221C8|nr:permease-like cell division protein FtsX [Euzebya tangerina]